MNNQKQVLFIFAGKFFALVATFLVPMILTRFLTIEEYGIYAQFYTVVLFVAAIFSMGFPISLYYFYQLSDDNSKKNLIFQTFLILIFLAVLSLLFVNIPFINNYILGTGLNSYFLYVAISLVLAIPITILEPLYILEKDNKMSVFFPPFEVLLKALIVIVMVLVWHSVEMVFRGIVIASLIIFSVVIFYIVRLIRNIRVIYNWPQIVDQIKYSIPFGLAVTLKTIAFRIDKIICLSILSPSDFAIYAVAFYGIPGIQQIYDSLVQVYIINMTKEYQNGNIEKLSSLYKTLTIKTFSYTLPIVLIVGLFANQIIITLFSEKYIDSIPYFRLYLLTVLFMSLGSGLILRATAKTRKTLKAYIISSTISIPLTFYLIQNYHLWGAITSAIVASILPIIFSIRMDKNIIKKSLEEHLPWNGFLKITLISISAVIPFFILNHFYDINLIVTALLMLTYLIIVFYFEHLNNLFVLDSQILSQKLKIAILKFESIIKKNSNNG